MPFRMGKQWLRKASVTQPKWALHAAENRIGHDTGRRKIQTSVRVSTYPLWLKSPRAKLTLTMRNLRIDWDAAKFQLWHKHDHQSDPICLICSRDASLQIWGILRFWGLHPDAGQSAGSRSPNPSILTAAFPGWTGTWRGWSLMLSKAGWSLMLVSVLRAHHQELGADTPNLSLPTPVPEPLS